MLQKISVVIPCRNEEAYISKVLENVTNQDYPSDHIEVFIIDGSSTDNTVGIAGDYVKKHNNFFLLNNPDKTVPFALNIAIRACKGDLIVRLDAHSIYESDYISKIVETFNNYDADIAGGPMRAIGKTDYQKAVAYCTSTKMGVGNSAFHDSQAQGWVDSVYLGAWKREIFIDVGLFDTDMVRNQDDEFHYRARSKGKKIYLNPEIKSYYFPRDTFRKLFKQYFQYGLYKPLVLKKVQSGLQLRHLIPACFVIYLVSIPVLYYLIGFYSLILLFVYLIALTVFSTSNELKLLQKCYCPFIYSTLHVSYGTGFILGLLRISIKAH